MVKWILTSASVNSSALCSVENVMLCIFLLAPANKRIFTVRTPDQDTPWYLTTNLKVRRAQRTRGRIFFRLYIHATENPYLFYTYWDFRIKFCCEKKRFGFYFEQSERRNEFLTRAKIVSSNHKPRFKRIVFSRAFSRLALSGSFDKIIFSVNSSCS